MLKECFTIMLTCSAMGESKSCAWLGRPRSPRIYWHHLKGWMTSSIFVEYLKWLNKMLMHFNCWSHMSVTLSKEAIKFLLKNTLSRPQLLDEAITAILKRAYTKYMMVDILRALLLVALYEITVMMLLAASLLYMLDMYSHWVSQYIWLFIYYSTLHIHMPAFAVW